MTENYNSNLFLDNKYLRLTSTGVNCYTKKLKDENEKKLHSVFCFIEGLKNTLFIDKSINKCKRLSPQGNIIVNDCINNLRKKQSGYVFNYEQIKEVIRMYGFGFNIVIDMGVYFLYPHKDIFDEVVMKN